MTPSTNTEFQVDFSANSSSEVDDSAATQLGCGANGAEFVGHSIDSTQTDVDKSIVGVGGHSEKCVKKISDTFGQRTSIYKGVTRHRWTGRYEAHLYIYGSGSH
ncbi:unnamed protein product [Amaranthus hypochondriacus]